LGSISLDVEPNNGTKPEKGRFHEAKRVGVWLKLTHNRMLMAIDPREEIGEGDFETFEGIFLIERPPLSLPKDVIPLNVFPAQKQE
jgi:hypothetical protein